MLIDDIRQLFPGLDQTIYLNTATMNVGNTLARQAYERAVADWSAGRFDWPEAEQAGEEARVMFAELIGASAGEIALIPAASSAAGVVAVNLPSARPGENIIVAGNEFSSNYFPWLLLRERGYEVRTVLPVDEGFPVDAYARLADGGTRLIAASAVHSHNGYQTDLGALSVLAARSGAWFFVDASQAAGAVPINVARDGIDFLAAASHKFLLGSRGMGYLYVRRELLERIRPVGPGWKAARKPMESFYGPDMDLSPTASKLDGSLAWFASLAERASLGIFRRFGTGLLLERNAALALRLHEALLAHGSSFRPFPPGHRSTIVSVPVADTEGAMARLRSANVVASVRAGRVRLSLQFYNREEEIDRVAELVAGA
jgi:selenocysteine lyase/cysteine desulfurase